MFRKVDISVMKNNPYHFKYLKLRNCMDRAEIAQLGHFTLNIHTEFLMQILVHVLLLYNEI